MSFKGQTLVWRVLAFVGIIYIGGGTHLRTTKLPRFVNHEPLTHLSCASSPPSRTSCRIEVIRDVGPRLGGSVR